MASKIVRLTVVFKSAEEGGFIARVPALPGCVTQGETLKEAEGMVKDAIKAYCASLKKHGETLPVAMKEVVESVSIKPEATPFSAISARASPCGGARLFFQVPDWTFRARGVSG